MMLKNFMSVIYQVKEFLEDASKDAETPLLGLTREAKVSETIVGPYQGVYFRGTWWPRAICHSQAWRYSPSYRYEQHHPARGTIPL